MSKKFVLVFVFLFFGFRVAHAAVAINEIMYDLDGGDIDWIEVVNQGNTDEDLTALKLLISNSTSNHAINNFSGNSILHAGDYGVIVGNSVISNYTNKWGNIGNIFTSSFSLSNDTDQIQINNGDKNSPISSVTYASSQGASGDGNSLQLINGSWVSATPTPGTANQISPSDTSAVTTSTGGGGLPANDSSSNIVANTETKNKTTTEQKIKIQITGKTLGFVGLPLTLQATAFGFGGEKLYSGKYFWNFGDGDSKEMSLTDVEPFSHTYFYPGDYVISLEYYQNYYSGIPAPDASSQMTVKIIGADVSISRVGDEKDFFVELTNNTDYSADLSNWFLTSDQKSFMIPRNTILPSKKTIIISPKITGFSIVDKNSLKLANPEGEVVFDYSVIAVPVVVSQGLTTTMQPSKSPLSGGLSNSSSLDKGRLGGVESDVALASAISSNAAEDNQTSNSHFAFVSIISFVFIGAAASGVYFIRRKKVVPQAGNDFEILDE